MTDTTQVNNLVALLDGYAVKGGHHLRCSEASRKLSSVNNSCIWLRCKLHQVNS